MRPARVPRRTGQGRADRCRRRWPGNRAAQIRRASSRVSRFQIGNIACMPILLQIFLAIGAQVFQKNIAERHAGERLSRNAVRALPAFAPRTWRWTHCGGIRTAWSGRPSDSACRSSNSRRTPCMLIRSYSSVTVVSSAVTRYSSHARAARAAPSRCPFRRSSRKARPPTRELHSWRVVYFTPMRNSRPSAGKPYTS